MGKSSPKYAKVKSSKKKRICPICKNPHKTYNSSSLGRHLKTVHGPKWECPFFLHKFTDKNSQKICFQKEKKLLQSFISNFIYNQSNKYFNICSYTVNLSYLFNEKKHAYLP